MGFIPAVNSTYNNRVFILGFSSVGRFKPCISWKFEKFLKIGGKRSEFELVKQNWFANIFECSKEKNFAKNFLDLWIILWKMWQVLTKFCELI